MQNHLPPEAIAAIILVPSFFFFLASLFWFHSYTGLKRDMTFLAVVGSLIVGAIFSIHRVRSVGSLPPPFNHNDAEFQSAELYFGIAATGLLWPLVAAFFLRLWGRCIGTQATDAERQPGVEGIRAWFCPSNITVGALIVLCAWLGYEISPLWSVVVLAALLAACPLVRMEPPTLAAAAAGPAPAMAEDLSAEREKIVSMLEAGKLTVEESAELLQALGESSRSAPRTVPLTGGQRLLLVGASLVAVGFFLPWLTFDPGKEASHMLKQISGAMHSFNSGEMQMPALPNIPFVNGDLKLGTISYSGGDIPHGLGWAGLALAITAALLPYLAVNLDPRTARTIRALCLGIGSFIILYLLTQYARFAGVGLIIAIAGYALAIAGALREWRGGVPG
jgi:hypothetical protein